MSSKLIQCLESGPCTNAELPYRVSPCRLSVEDINRVRQIRVAQNRTNKPRHGKFLTVYYIEGDEDRAIERFISVNKQTLKSINFHTYSTLDSGMSRKMSQKVRAAMICIERVVCEEDEQNGEVIVV